LVEAKEFRSYFEGIEKTLEVRDVRADEAIEAIEPIEAIEAIEGREACPGMCSELFWRSGAENRLISAAAHSQLAGAQEHSGCHGPRYEEDDAHTLLAVNLEPPVDVAKGILSQYVVEHIGDVGRN
jgi:hypothetical protein